MRFATAVVAWVYDFLAEDITLVIGMIIAVGVTIAVARLSSGVAGFVLWAIVLLAIGFSLARTAGIGRL